MIEYNLPTVVYTGSFHCMLMRSPAKNLDKYLFPWPSRANQTQSSEHNESKVAIKLYRCSRTKNDLLYLQITVTLKINDVMGMSKSKFKKN